MQTSTLGNNTVSFRLDFLHLGRQMQFGCLWNVHSMNWQIRPVSLKVKQHSLKIILCHFHLAACLLAIYHSPFRQHLCFKCVKKYHLSYKFVNWLEACVPNKRAITLVNHLQRGSFFVAIYCLKPTRDICKWLASTIRQIFLWRWLVLLNSRMWVMQRAVRQAWCLVSVCMGKRVYSNTHTHTTPHHSDLEVSCFLVSSNPFW